MKTINKILLLASFCVVCDIHAVGYADVVAALGGVDENPYSEAILKAAYIQVPEGNARLMALSGYYGKQGVADSKTKLANAQKKKATIDGKLPKNEAEVGQQFANLMTGAGQPGTALVAKFGKP